MYKYAVRTLALLMACLCLALPLYSQADLPKALWLQHASGVATSLQGPDGRAIDALDAHKAGWYVYHLFLPAWVDTQQLALGFSSMERLQLADGSSLHSGDPVHLPPGTATYLQHRDSKFQLHVMQGSQIPALFITTASGGLDYIHKVKGNWEEGQLLLVMPDGSIAYQGPLTQVRGRGNASFTFSKKGYRIKLPEKVDICGMGPHKTWELLANYRDNSLIRNILSYQMARAAGLRFSPQAQVVDVYMNNAYMGTYDLTTRVEVDKTRVAITDLEKTTEKLNQGDLKAFPAFGKAHYAKGSGKGLSIPNNPDDITGGYLLELEYRLRYPNETSGFVTTRGQAVVIKSPEEASQQQVDYISALIQQVENGIFARDGVDPVSGIHYSQLVDLESFAIKYVLEELVKNYDANNSSQFFYKETDQLDSRIYAGPVWDYDSAYAAFGKGPTSASLKPEGLYVATQPTSTYSLYPALYRQADFRQAVQEVWQQVYLPIVRSVLGLPGGNEDMPSIQQLAIPLTQSARMNQSRWPTLNSSARVAKTGTTFEENLDYLANFLTRRAEFLCTQWGGSLMLEGN